MGELILVVERHEMVRKQLDLGFFKEKGLKKTILIGYIYFILPSTSSSFRSRCRSKSSTVTTVQNLGGRQGEVVHMDQDR